MKIPLNIMVAIFAFSAIVFFAQSCGNNTPERFSKGPKSVGTNGKTNPQTPDLTGGQQQAGGSQTQAGAGAGSGSGVATGSGSTGSTSNFSVAGASGEITPPASSSSSSSSSGSGDCADTDNEGPNQFPEAEDKGQGLAYYTPDDNFKCCKNDAKQQWDCYEGSTFTNSQKYSDYSGSLPILPN